MNLYKIALISFLSIVFFFNLSFAGQTSDREKYLGMGAEELSGLVVDVGAYNFIIQDKQGKEFNIHTDSKLIQFQPNDERLIVGDKIRLIYIGGKSASGAVDRRLALMVDFDEMVPRNFVSGTTSCVFLARTRGTSTCYLPEHNKTITVEGSIGESVRFGDKVEIRITVVPARIGNGYVYTARATSW